MQHPVTIGANQGQVLEPRLAAGLKLRKGCYVMTFNEPFAQVSVCLLEVEPADFTGEPPTILDDQTFLLSGKTGTSFADLVLT